MSADQLTSSFRDPGGFVFKHNNRVYRHVERTYAAEFDKLMTCGLYDELVEAGLLIPHEPVELAMVENETTHRVLKPQTVPFISYPYEWCFSQLKDAALCTLTVQKMAMKYGMSLKDASAFNIQFVKGKPLLIDTLSFEKYEEGRPWMPYRQFCQHFLAPLALMACKDLRLNRLLQLHIDGIPLDLASNLLPRRALLNLGLFTHIFLHAKADKLGGKPPKPLASAAPELSDQFVPALIDSLESALRSLRFPQNQSVWSEYYADNNYSEGGLDSKIHLVSDFVKELNPRQVWDLGANVGLFSRLTASFGIETISMDLDPACVEANYAYALKSNEKHILALQLDLAAPTPGIGWANEERLSLLQRGPTDMILALALIHHLAIANNLPINRIAKFFARMCNSLIIEFVPRTDSQVQRLLGTRADVFADYTQANFENEFIRYFDIQRVCTVKDSDRRLYLMTNLSQTPLHLVGVLSSE